MEKQCKPPLTWAMVCECGKVVCRFISYPGKDFFSKRLGKHQLAFHHGKFSAHARYFTKRSEKPDVDDGVCPYCGKESMFAEHYKLERILLTTRELFQMLRHIENSIIHMSEALSNINQLRCYAESCKISLDSIDTLYDNALSSVNALKKLYMLKSGVEYLDKEVPEDVEF